MDTDAEIVGPPALEEAQDALGLPRLDEAVNRSNSGYA